MKIVKNITEFYHSLINNEKLLRLLYYIPKDQFDDPLDESKLDVSQLPEKEHVLKNLIVIGDKPSDLSLETNFCRICLYTGPRLPQKNYLKNINQFTDNPYSSTQQYIFDIYTPDSVNNIDFRMDWLGEVLNEVLFQEDVEEFGDLRFHSGLPITNLPKGIIGYRWSYIMPSGQQPTGYRS
ncbi:MULTISPECIES: hypothetical protein [Lysinibacillus]|uniref:hypothetical protein n=1 Tax=Lysinibacillus TaxID=400634 RepID=UPI000564D96D|nr:MULTISPECIES: hypothetical protein [Lysinibacillus]MBI6863882.1 hypothetical protein [Lysinibacillus fusiformis]